MTRTAADIGAGLEPPRAARSIRAGERIHVLGIAGAGASAAALLAAGEGAIVTGCDSGGSSPYTPPLDAAGIEMAWSHDPAHVATTPPPDRLAVSKALTAVAPGHPELRAARTAGIPIQPWQQVVADAAYGRTLIAVAGTHGKSTTAGWLTHVLVRAGRDPSAFVGALLPAAVTGALPATARHGRGAAVVVEADEYAGNFDAYAPDVVAITNVDWDHPDVFADRAAAVTAFAAWLARVPEAMLVANAGDAGVAELLVRLGPRSGRTIGVAVGDPTTAAPVAELAGVVLGSTPIGTNVRMTPHGDPPFDVHLATAGIHNVANALLVAATARAIGLSDAEIRDGLESFSGVGRRLERKGEAGDVVVYDDYGHHPTAIRATIEAVRQREPGRRLWVACEPLTFHRTAALLQELAHALSGADGVAVADIWPGRDPDRTVASAAGLAEATRTIAGGKPVAAPGDVEATADWLAGEVRPGDAVLVMGGGHSYRIGERLLEALRGRAASDAP